MATKCPNKNSEEWKLLVNSIGEIEAFGIFLANNEEVPEMNICKEIVKKYNKIDNIEYNDKSEVLAPNGNVSKLYKDIEKLVEEQNSINYKFELKPQYIYEDVEPITQYNIYESGNEIGFLRVDDFGKENGNLNSPAIYIKPEYRGKGYSTQIYIQVGNELLKDNIKLQPDPLGNNEASKRIWNSLYKQGYVKKLKDDEFNGKEWILHYEFVGKQQALQLYKQTRSKEFKEWFGNSKVVDAQGEPLIVYHGSQNEFNTFKITNDVGYHFAKDKEVANIAAYRKIAVFSYNIQDYKNRTDEEKGVIYPAFIKLESPLYSKDLQNWALDDLIKEGIVDEKYKNPLDKYEGSLEYKIIQYNIDNNVEYKKINKLLDDAYEKDNDDLIDKYEDELKQIQQNIKNNVYNNYDEYIEKFNKSLINNIKGDGIIYKNIYEQFEDIKDTTSYIVFNSNQIKSVFNQGTFSSLEDNIYKSKELNIDYRLKAVDILLSDKAKQIFDKGNKNGWTIDRILTELAIPKEQKQLLIEIGSKDREQLAVELASKYNFAIEMNIAKYKDNVGIARTASSKALEEGYDIDSDEYENRVDELIKKYEKEGLFKPTHNHIELSLLDKYNSSDWEYNEIQINTPLIEPSIKGHTAPFNNTNGIGWIRIWKNSKTSEVEIQEIQSDLFQKGRNSKSLINDKTKIANFNTEDENGFNVESFYYNNIRYSTIEGTYVKYIEDEVGDEEEVDITKEEYEKVKSDTLIHKKDSKENQFLQLLNKNSNWVTFFIKSTVQKYAKEGYTTIRFPKGKTAAKIEGHETIAEEIRKIDEEIRQTEIILKENTNPFSQSTNKSRLEELNQKKQQYKDEGYAKLKPIEAFYEIKVGNILEKQFGKDNVKTITDEFGNEWREITIEHTRDLKNILLSRELDIKNQVPILSNTVNKIEQLQQVFKQYGINVPVVIDNDLQVKGEIRIINGKPTIHVRSDIFNDTIEHEFAHLYIELLGNESIINSAINQLKNTSLWNRVKEKYPELNDIKLGKEVLATAMGLHDSDIFKEVIIVEKGNSIIRLIKAIFAKIQKLLGIEPNIAKRLVNEMLSGKLRKEINIDNLSNFTYQSKEMNNSGMSNILELGKGIEVAKDKVGKELDYYTDKYSRIKGKLKRITDEMTGVLRNFYWIQPGRLSEEDWADKVWKKTDPNTKLRVGKRDNKNIKELLTKDEYILYLKRNSALYKASGRIAGFRFRYELEKHLGRDVEMKQAKTDVEIEHQNLLKENYITSDDSIMKHIHYTVKGTTEKLVARLLKNCGINTMIGEYKEGISDKPHFEVKLYNELLGVAGSADAWFEHADGTITRLEIKSGRKIADEENDTNVAPLLMKYGNIEYNEMNKAKLQDMWYAILGKSMNPELRFRGAYIPLLHDINSMLTKNKECKVTATETVHFLKVIETVLQDKNFIKEMNEGKEYQIPLDVYQKLINQSPNLFNPSHYTVESISNDIYSKIANTGTENQDSFQKQEAFIIENQMKLNGLQIAIAEDEKRLARGEHIDYEQYNFNKTEIVNITKELFQVNAKGRNLVLNPADGLQAFEGHFASLQHFTMPIMKVLGDIKDQRRRNVNTNYRRRMKSFDEVTLKMVKEWCVEHNISFNRFYANFNVSQLGKDLGVFDGLTTFEDLKGDGTNTERLIVVYKVGDPILNSYDSNRYVTIGNYVVRKEDVNLFNEPTMTETRKEWLVQANKLSAHYFVNKGDTKSYWNSTYAYTYEGKNVKESKTLGEVYNDGDTGRQFEYFEGWFPRIWEQSDELDYRTGYELTGQDNTSLNSIIGWLVYPFKYFEEWKNRRFTRYLDYNFEDYDNLGHGLPLKFLGNASLNRRLTYSRNLGLAFSAFTKNIEFKKEMDDVYVMGKGLEAYLEISGNKRFYKSEIAWLNEALPFELTGLTKPELEGNKIATSLLSFTGQKGYKIDWIKVINEITGWSARGMMAGRVKSASGNTVQASIITWQNALKDDIAQGKIPFYGKSGKLEKFIGINGNEIDFDRNSLDFGIQAYIDMIGSTISDDYRNNKLWLFGRKIGVLPKDFNMTVPYDMQIVRNKLMNSNDWYFIFYGIGEEAISYITAAAQLYHMQHAKESEVYTKKDIEYITKNEGITRRIASLIPGRNYIPKEGERKRIWDCYEVQDGELVWTGGTRRYITTGTKGNEVVTELTELDSRELRRLEEVYRQLQGSYKADENSTFGSTIAGKIFMPFKRWIPDMIRRQIGKKTSKEELGYYRPKLKDIQDDMKNIFERRIINGKEETVYEWHNRVIEGRLRTLAKITLYMMSRPLQAMGVIDKRWKPDMEHLTSEQKKNLIELCINFVFWASLALAYGKFFKDTDDDDTFKKWVKQYMIDNPSQLWNVTDMARTMSTAINPIAITKLAKTVENTGNLFGHLGGVALGFNNLENAQHNIPYLRRTLDIWWFSSMMRQFTDDVLHDKSIFNLYNDNKLR